MRVVCNWKFLEVLPQRPTHKCPARQMHLNPIEGPCINAAPRGNSDFY
jgi:hypothetical protein